VNSDFKPLLKPIKSKQPKSAEFIDVCNESETEALTTPPAATAAASVVEIKSLLQCDPRAYGELKKNLALSSSSSSESPHGGSDDERLMVLDECFNEDFLSDRGDSGTPPSTVSETF